MIRRELKSQLIELEKRYAAAVAAKRDEETAPGRWARVHAVEVAAVVLYGEPKIAEPLSVAHLQEKLDHWHRMGCKTSGFQTSQVGRGTRVGRGSPA